MDYFKFDTHMHFDLYKARNKTLEYCESEKSYTIAVTNLPDLYERYYKIYKDYKYIRIALGFHPELVSQYKSQISKFEHYIYTTKYIGEIGLDYSTCDKSNQNTQRLVFEKIINACKNEDNKVISVHSRKAENDVLSILNNYKGKVIMHWFSGSLKQVENCIVRGYYFSINQQMILGKKGKNIINTIPIDKILFESDAPFTKGLNNIYSTDFMNEIYRYLSKTRNMSIEELSLQLKHNFNQTLK